MNDRKTPPETRAMPTENRPPYPPIETFANLRRDSRDEGSGEKPSSGEIKPARVKRIEKHRVFVGAEKPQQNVFIFLKKL